jgi:hypothetical protein
MKTGCIFGLPPIPLLDVMFGVMADVLLLNPAFPVRR